MKTVYFTALILLFSISFCQAQNEATEVENPVLEVKENVETMDESNMLIDASELKQTIARGSSDIRIYFKRKRKAGNISFVFPKINKPAKV